MATTSDSITQSLETVGSNPAGVTVSEFARKLLVNKSTGSRVLQSLADAGLVEKVPHSGRYILGLKLWSIGAAARHAHRITDTALGPMIQFVKAHKVPLNLAVNRRGETIYLFRVEWMGDAVVALPSGAHPPAHANASGKALLAFGPPEDIDEAIANGLQPLGPNTVTSPEVLRRQLTGVRAQGYARNVAELREGHCGVAIPVFDFTGTAVAAVSAACTLDEWDKGFEERIVGPLKELAFTISRYLGFETAAPVAALA